MPLRIITDVALNDISAIAVINIADKLDENEPSVFPLQRKVTVSDVAVFLKFIKGFLIQFSVSEGSNIPKIFSNKFFLYPCRTLCSLLI